MAKSAGLIRKPLISECFHLFSFNSLFSFAEVLPRIGRSCIVFIELLDGGSGAMLRIFIFGA
jgi:hypothetical protein